MIKLLKSILADKLVWWAFKLDPHRFIDKNKQVPEIALTSVLRNLKDPKFKDDEFNRAYCIEILEAVKHISTNNAHNTN